MNRATPYHLAHSTDVSGYTFMYGADDRFYNNIFVGKPGKESEIFVYGTAGFKDGPISFEEYIDAITEATAGHGNTQAYPNVRQPLYTGGNVYLNGAEPSKREECVKSSVNPEVTIIEQDGNVYLEMNITKELTESHTQIVNSELLGTVRLVEETYQTSDGEEVIIDRDYFGEKRSNQPIPGPFENVENGKMKDGMECIEVEYLKLCEYKLYNLFIEC